VRPAEFLSHDELQQRLAAAHVLVNPRPVDQDFVRYSFPSKLIEYLAAGTPVITTRLPGIPSDYDRKVVFAEADTAAGLREALSHVMDMAPGDTEVLSKSASEFIRTTRSAESQGKRIRSFLGALEPATGFRMGQKAR
jgi:glycosyltransferase involved in cell wall biosynthesis